jgi:hypothetical protein
MCIKTYSAVPGIASTSHCSPPLPASELRALSASLIETSPEAAKCFPPRRFVKKNDKSQQGNKQATPWLVGEKPWTLVNARVSKCFGTQTIPKQEVYDKHRYISLQKAEIQLF